MAILHVLTCLFALLAITSADPEDPISELQGWVYMKNVEQRKYLVFDPLSWDIEPKALLWNVPNTAPNQGGAWFRMARSPNQTLVDYNFVGGVRWNITLCASMTHPTGGANFHNVHGNVDDDRMETPECRWEIKLSPDTKNYFMANRLYGGHLSSVDDKFRVDPLRRPVFVAVKVKGDTREKWEIGRVAEPNDRKPKHEDYWPDGERKP